MKKFIKFKKANYGYYEWKYSNEEGFELPLCPICKAYMIVNRVKFDNIYFCCKEDIHDIEATMDYITGEIKYIEEER